MPYSVQVQNEYQVVNAAGFPIVKIRLQTDGSIVGIRCNATGVEQEEAFRIPVIGPRSITTTDSVATITASTEEVTINQTAGTQVTLTGSSYPGQRVRFRVASSSGGATTLVVTGGTLTLNSAGEAATVVRNIANTAWVVEALTASSSTGANIATIV